MTRLSDTQLAFLLDEIAAAVEAELPVAEAMDRLRHRRGRALVSAARQIGEGLARGESLPATMAKLPTPLSGAAAASVEMATRNGNVSLLRSIARQLRHRAESSRQLRIAWVYPVILMIVAYLVAVAVMAPLIRRFETSGIEWSPLAVQSANWMHAHPVLPGLLIGLAVVAGSIWQSKRSRFPRGMRRYLFCQALADQLHHGMAEDDAIRNAAAISADAELQSVHSLTLESPQIKRLLGTVDDPPIDGFDSQTQWVARLREAALRHLQSYQRWDWIWARSAPRLATFAVGGGMILLYACFVLAPVYMQVGR